MRAVRGESESWVVSEVYREHRAARHRGGDFGHKRDKMWYQRYRNRIRLGLEHCRGCGKRSRYLTFDHVVPWILGGRTVLENATILCSPCNVRKGNQVGGEWARLVSLTTEESRPGAERWSRTWVIQEVKAVKKKSRRKRFSSVSPLRTKIDPAVVESLRERVKE